MAVVRPTTFANYKAEGHKWITLATGEYYPDILKDACEPMGDFVNHRNSDPEDKQAVKNANHLPLFQSLELRPEPSAATTSGDHHRPIRNFTLYADERVAADIAGALDQWRNDIDEAAPFAVAKEMRSSYSAERGSTPSRASASGPWAPAVRHLIQADPILGKIIHERGPCRLRKQTGGFSHLAEAILNQQLSKIAAATIATRLRCLTHGKPLSARLIESSTDADLRSAGVSARKTEYLRDLAAKTLSGELDFHRLPHLSDEEVIQQLTQVKGIGRWTAEMYLIFVLARPDVFPANDVALKSAMAEVYALKTIIEPRRLADITDKWKPHRTTACWYLWAWRNRQTETNG